MLAMLGRRRFSFRNLWSRAANELVLRMEDAR
jgi:hypothetical protein